MVNKKESLLLSNLNTKITNLNLRKIKASHGKEQGDLATCQVGQREPLKAEQFP